MALKGGFISVIPSGLVPTSLVEHSCQPVLPISQNITVAPGRTASETIFHVVCRILLQYIHQEKVVECHLPLSLFQAGGGESPLLVETDYFPS